MKASDDEHAKLEEARQEKENERMDTLVKLQREFEQNRASAEQNRLHVGI